MKKPLTIQQAIMRCVDACNRCEQCSHDIHEKVLRMGLSRESAEKVVEYLTDERLLDDRRFAALFAEDKLRFSGWGPRKIANALYVKRISRDDIADAIDALDPEEVASTLGRVLKARLAGTSTQLQRDELVKVIKFGMARGFDYEAVKDTLKRLLEEE